MLTFALSYIFLKSSTSFLPDVIIEEDCFEISSESLAAASDFEAFSSVISTFSIEDSLKILASTINDFAATFKAYVPSTPEPISSTFGDFESASPIDGGSENWALTSG